jgi:hypothetical protein
MLCGGSLRLAWRGFHGRWLLRGRVGCSGRARRRWSPLQWLKIVEEQKAIEGREAQDERTQCIDG